MLYDATEFTINDVIIYLRKSRSDDPYMSVEDVLARHEELLQDYATAAWGSKVPEAHIFREVVSGETIADRPVMKEVMKLLESGIIKGVLVVEPQRLSRGDLEDCGRIINTFRYTSTLVITPPKTYNLSDEYDRKFFEMELTRGNDYLEYTKKILNRGRIASAKHGNFIGSVAPYGYRKVQKGTGKDACHTLEIVPEEAASIKLMYHLFVNEGFGFTKIARYLDGIGAKPRRTEHWSPAAIRDMLENPVYIGMIRWNRRRTEKILVDGQIIKTRPITKDESQWIYVNGRHEAIIDEATFFAAAERRGRSPRISKGSGLKNPFAGIMFCGTCGRAMSYKEYTDSRTATGHVCRSMLCSNQAVCGTRSVRYDDILCRVISALKSAIADFEFKLQDTDDGNDNAERLNSSIIASLENDLKRLKARDAKQKDAYEDGLYTKEEYLSRNACLQRQLSKTSEALLQAVSAVTPASGYENKITHFADCLSALESSTISPEEKNIFIRACIEKIVYHNHLESKPGVGRYSSNSFDLDIYLRL